MNDHHGSLRRLGDPQDAAHGLRLQIVGAGLGMAGDGVLALGLLLGHQRVDDAAVLAVDAADAAPGLQRLQGPVQVAVRQHHGGIGHVHLEGGDAGGEHVVQLPFDALVPVVDGHVEAVVTVAVRRLPVPEVEAVGQGLALVGAGKVDDGGGAAAQGGAAAALEIVGGGGVAHVQVEVGVGVDEARQQQLAGHVHHLGVRRVDMGRHGGDLLAVHQHVGHHDAAAADHAAAGKESFHRKVPPQIIIFVHYSTRSPAWIQKFFVF